MPERHTLGWQILLPYRCKEFIWKESPGSWREGKVAKGRKEARVYVDKLVAPMDNCI